MHFTKLVLATLPLVLFASEQEEITKAEQPSHRKCKKIDRIDEISEQNVQGSWEGLTRSYLTTNQAYVVADLLILQPQEKGLEYCTKIDYDAGKSKIKDLDFDWNAGVRVGIGTSFGSGNFWEMFLGWMHYHGMADGSASTSNINRIPIAPSWFNFGLGVVGHSHAHWSMNLDTVDLEFGRHYFAGSSFSIRPHAGLRWAQIDQKYEAKYSNGFSNIARSDPIPTTNIHFKNDYWGIGIRAGSDAAYHFNQNWSLFARCSASLLYGKFDIVQNSLIDVGTSSLVPQRARDKFWSNKANLEGAFGFTWERYFNHHKNHVTCSVAYEIGQWFQQNQMAQSITLVSEDLTVASGLRSQQFFRQNGDLGYQGVSIELRFDF